VDRLDDLELTFLSGFISAPAIKMAGMDTHPAESVDINVAFLVIGTINDDLKPTFAT
jgi:hypothetical protein